MQEAQEPGEEAEEERAEDEGPEAPEELPPPALGHGTATKESAQNRGARWFPTEMTQLSRELYSR
jgi:hypothetical protein